MNKVGSWVMGYGLWVVVIAILTSCSLSPDFKLPDLQLPDKFKEQPAPNEQAPPSSEQLNWKPVETLVKADRGQWWTIFADEKLNDLEKQAIDANQSLKAATARVLEARGTAESNVPSLLPDLSIGANAQRTQPANASLAAFGQPAANLHPYTLYQGQGILSYELDLFGQVRDNYKAFSFDADAQEGLYRGVLLALQADVAQNYFALRALDSERQLVRDTVAIRQEANRIMQHRFDVGDSGEADLTRTQSELASAKADLLSFDRQRSTNEHALAVLLGKLPSEFAFADAPLTDMPPAIPAGLPSTLLERRPDIASAQAAMQAANKRIGVARTAFFPSISLTASGGYESTQLSNLFHWGSRTWALGQTAGNAIVMPIFDSGRNMARLDVAHATYDESVANYRQQVLVAFRDVEDNLAAQKLLGDQSVQQDVAAKASARTTSVVEERYHAGDIDFFQVVDAQRDSLAAGRAAVQVRGQRFITTVNLVRALGGSWGEVVDANKDKPAADVPAPAVEAKPVEQKPAEQKPVEDKPVEEKPAANAKPLIDNPAEPAPAEVKSDTPAALPAETPKDAPVSCGNSPIKFAC